MFNRCVRRNYDSQSQLVTTQNARAVYAAYVQLTRVTVSLPLVDTVLLLTSALYSLGHAVSAGDRSKTFFVFFALRFICLLVLPDCNVFLLCRKLLTIRIVFSSFHVVLLFDFLL